MERPKPKPKPKSLPLPPRRQYRRRHRYRSRSRPQSMPARLRSPSPLPPLPDEMYAAILNYIPFAWRASHIPSRGIKWWLLPDMQKQTARAIKVQSLIRRRIVRNDQQYELGVIERAIDNENNVLIRDYLERKIIRRQEDLEHLLNYAAFEGNIEACRLLIMFGAKDWNAMLRNAAQRENIAICKLAKRLGATNFREMYNIGLDHDYDRIVRLARKWMNQ